MKISIEDFGQFSGSCAVSHALVQVEHKNYMKSSTGKKNLCLTESLQISFLKVRHTLAHQLPWLGYYVVIMLGSLTFTVIS